MPVSPSRPLGRKKTIAFTIGFSVFSVVAALALGELGLYLLQELRPKTLDYADARCPILEGVYRKEGWLKAGFSGRVADGYGGTAPWTNNAASFRFDRELAENPPPGVLRLLAMGDSYVAGYRVGQHDTFSALLGQWISERFGPAETPAANVEEAANALYSLDRHGRFFLPRIVLLGLTFGNDFSQTNLAIAPEGYFRFTEGNATHVLEPNPKEAAVAMAVRLSLLTLPPEARRESPLLPRLLARVREKTRLGQALIPLFTKGQAMSSGYYNDKVNPRLFDPNHALGYFLATTPKEIEGAMANTDTVLTAFGRYCRERDMGLAVLLFPQRFQVQDEDWDRTVLEYQLNPAAFDLRLPNRRLAEICRREGLLCIDPTEALRRRRLAEKTDFYLPRGDMHWNKAGHRAFFEILREDKGLAALITSRHPRTSP